MMWRKPARESHVRLGEIIPRQQDHVRDSGSLDQCPRFVRRLRRKNGRCAFHAFQVFPVGRPQSFRTAEINQSGRRRRRRQHDQRPTADALSQRVSHLAFREAVEIVGVQGPVLRHRADSIDLSWREKNNYEHPSRQPLQP